jgi:hypothetical protein
MQTSVEATMTSRPIYPLAAMLLAVSTSGCSSILGAACVSRQQRAHVTSIAGEAAPGTVIMHEVAYGTAGSQNDISIKWAGKNDAGGPRLRVYATKVECDAFDPQARLPRGSACAPVGSGSSTVSPDARPCVRDKSCTVTADDLVQWGLTISHGRGNPEHLAPAARYKLWIVTDAWQATRYTIDVTSFYGHSC